MFNPFDEGERSNAQKAVGEAIGTGNDTVKLRFNDLKSKIESTWADEWYKKKYKNSGYNGIFYRPLLPYTFAIEINNTLYHPTVVYLPNKAPILSIDISRKAFIPYKLTIDFENGILKQVTWVKSSEVVGFLKIPIDVAKAIVSIPAELLTVKVNNITQEKNLINA